jgi:hypothetical protein
MNHHYCRSELARLLEGKLLSATQIEASLALQLREDGKRIQHYRLREALRAIEQTIAELEDVPVSIQTDSFKLILAYYYLRSCDREMIVVWYYRSMVVYCSKQASWPC